MARTDPMKTTRRQHFYLLTALLFGMYVLAWVIPSSAPPDHDPYVRFFRYITHRFELGANLDWFAACGVLLALCLAASEARLTLARPTFMADFAQGVLAARGLWRLVGAHLFHWAIGVVFLIVLLWASSYGSSMSRLARIQQGPFGAFVIFLSAMGFFRSYLVTMVLSAVYAFKRGDVHEQP